MSKKPSIIVPARLAASRFPEKLLHKVRDKPILLWTAERIRDVAPDYPLYFAIDDKRLESCLTEHGFRVIYTSTAHQSGTDRLAEANASIGAHAVINVQGDEPLVTREQIDQLAAGLETNAAMATLAVPFESADDFRNPNQVKVVCDSKGNALYFSRAPVPFSRDKQDAIDEWWLKAHPCYRHLGLYAYDAEFLEAFRTLPQGFLEGVEKLEQLRALEHGYQIHVGITDRQTIGIDTLEDAKAFEASLPA